MRAVIVCGLAILCCSCGSKTPAAPTPIPIAVANIVSTGGGTFTGCNTVFCTMTMPMRNDGPGCGTDVKGTVTFFNAQNQTLGSEQWNLAMATIVRAGESFVITKLLASSFQVATTYRVDPAWTNVRCP